jgi:hypothetical protein
MAEGEHVLKVRLFVTPATLRGAAVLFSAADVVMNGTDVPQAAFTCQGRADDASAVLRRYPGIVQDAIRACVRGRAADDDEPAVTTRIVAEARFDEPRNCTCVALDSAAPTTHRIVSAAWTQPLQPLVVVPTAGVPGLSTWRHSVVVANVRGATGFGSAAAGSLRTGLRWDWLAECGMALGECADGDTRFALVAGGATPDHDLWLPLAPRDPADRAHVGITGARAVDCTAQRLVVFIDVGFHTLPLVCGCLVRNSILWRTSHVPLELTADLSVAEPVRFEDGPSCVVLVARESKQEGAPDTPPELHRVFIDTQRRHEFGGVPWLEVWPSLEAMAANAAPPVPAAPADEIVM